MLIKKLKLIAATLIILIICCIFIYNLNPPQVFGLEIVGGNKGLSISHNNPLFNMQKMVPGDIGNAVVTIKNEGNTPFSIIVDSKKENGDDMLFQELIFTVKDDDNTYYHGLLKDLDNTKLNSISPSESENITLSVLFPAHLGNEFQNKTLSVKLIFSTVNINDNSIHGNTQTGDTGESTAVLGVVIFSLIALLAFIKLNTKSF